MKRSGFLLGILIAIVAGHWVLTFYFYNSLPPKLQFTIAGLHMLTGTWFYLIFPVISSLLAALALALFRFKQMIPFWGKRLLKDLEGEYVDSIRDRAYQVVIMTVLFITMLLAYVQLNLGLYSTGVTEFNISTAYMVAPVILIYIVFNQFMLKRMADAADRARRESQDQ